jgi:hypothetical protein
VYNGVHVPVLDAVVNSDAMGAKQPIYRDAGSGWTIARPRLTVKKFLMENDVWTRIGMTLLDGLHATVVEPVIDWGADMHTASPGRMRDHSEAMTGALGTVVLAVIMPGEGAVVELAPALTDGSQVTAQMIRTAMEDAPLISQQAGGVSLPRVQAYVTRLINGEVAPPVKVDGNMLVDGNHRYVAGRVFGSEPGIQPWVGGRPGNAVPWSELVIDPVSW